MRHNLIALSIALGLLSIGCATERPTRHTERVPTLNLSDEIVSWTSGRYDLIVYTDSMAREAHLQIPRQVLDSVRNATDILLEYIGPRPCGPAKVEIWDESTSGWVMVEDQRHPTGCWGWPKVTKHNTLRPFAIEPVESFFNDDNTLHIRGDFEGPVVSILDVNPEYRPFVVSVGASAMTCEWIGDNLATQFMMKGESQWIVDSLVLLSPGCNRLSAIESPETGISELMWSGTELWAMVVVPDKRIGIMGDDGVLYPSFRFTLPADGIPSTNCFGWVNGRIWSPYIRRVSQNTNRLSIMVIDPYESVLQGRPIYDSPINIDSSLILPIDITSHKSVVLMAFYDRIVELNTQGQILDTLPLPVRPSSITSDGESLWIVHRGPSVAPTLAPVLSRFYPR